MLPKDTFSAVHCSFQQPASLVPDRERLLRVSVEIHVLQPARNWWYLYEHMSLELHSKKAKARKPPKSNLVEEKQILSLFVLQMTGASVSCPWKKLKHYGSARLAREPKCGDYRCTNNLLVRSRRETTASDSFENQSRLCEMEVWVMWYPVNQTRGTNRSANWD